MPKLKNKNFYFPLEFDFINDDKICRVLKKFGSSGGFAVVYFWCQMGKQKDHSLNITDEDYVEYISECVEMPIDKFNSFVEYCLKIKLFHRDKDGKLYSERFLKQMNEIKKISETNRKSALARWSKKKTDPAPESTPNLEDEPETLRSLVPAGEQVPMTDTQKMTAFEKREKKMQLATEYHDLMTAIKNVEKDEDKPYYWKDMLPCTKWLFDFAKNRMKKVVEFEKENILEQQAIIEFLKMIYVGNFLPWNYEDQIVANGLVRESGNKDFAMKNFYNNFINFMKAEHADENPKFLSPAVRYVILHTEKI
jgi:hypothetical protein